MEKNLSNSTAKILLAFLLLLSGSNRALAQTSTDLQFSGWIPYWAKTAGVEDVVTAVEMVADLDIDDMTEYFTLIEAYVSSRRFNALSLVRGLPVSVNHGGPFIEHRDMIVTQRINEKLS